MAARKKKPARKAGRRKTTRRARAALARLEQEIQRAQANPRREAARLLREASHALGRWETEGERQWRRLAGPARREALRLLHRLEAALEAPKRRKAVRRITRRRVAAS